MEEKQNVFWQDSIKQFLYETNSLSFCAGRNDFKIAQKLYTIYKWSYWATFLISTISVAIAIFLEYDDYNFYVLRKDETMFEL